MPFVIGKFKSKNGASIFLGDNDNKTDLFNFLADKIVERCQGTVVIVTRKEGAVSNQLISLEGIAPCNHEEADS